MDTLPPKPQIYNRPWHLDLDDRRHQGARRWEREALLAVVDLLAGIECLYPPDWSDRDRVIFRASGGGVFATVRTDVPEQLVLTLPSSHHPRIGDVEFRLATGAEVDTKLRSLVRTSAQRLRVQPASRQAEGLS